MKGAITAAVVSYSVSSVWVYTWPYGDNNACKCESRTVGGYLSFSEASECLKAFAEEEYEFCTYEGEGIYLHDCDSAVSVYEGVTNTDCHEECTKLVANALTFDEFAEACKFEPIVEFSGQGIAPVPAGCFGNFVFGWADYDPHNTLQQAPLQVYHEVDTGAECQLLCQMNSECVAFTWRGATTPAEEAAGAFENPVHTCLLFDSDYINGVLNVSVNEELILAGGNQFCDATQLNAECQIGSLFNGSTYSPFLIDHCLMCGCTQKCSWKSTSHISGPAFCNKPITDFCEIQRPVWTTSTSSTAPPATCPDAADTHTCAEDVTPAGDVERTATTVQLEADETTPAEEEDLSLTTVQLEEDETTTGLVLDTTEAAEVKPTEGAEVKPTQPCDTDECVDDADEDDDDDDECDDC